MAELAVSPSQIPIEVEQFALLKQRKKIVDEILPISKICSCRIAAKKKLGISLHQATKQTRHSVDTQTVNLDQTPVPAAFRPLVSLYRRKRGRPFRLKAGSVAKQLAGHVADLIWGVSARYNFSVAGWFSHRPKEETSR